MSLMRKMADALGAFGLMKVDGGMLVQRSLEPCGQKDCQHNDSENLAPPFSHDGAKLLLFAFTCNNQPDLERRERISIFVQNHITRS